MKPPHDLDAERGILGGLLMGHSHMDAVFDVLTPQDFYSPLHAALFDTARTVWKRGDRLDPVVVRDELGRNGWDLPGPDLMTLISDGSLNTPALVDILTRHSVSRRVLAAALEVAERAAESVLPPSELVDLARERTASVDAPDASADLATLTTVDDFLRTADLTPAPWVVPGLLRAGWRCLVVAPEGVGKSVASRQVAIAAASGVHPFTHKPITPVRTLIVDLENPDDAIADTCKPITERAKEQGDYQPDRAWIWRKAAGIDLRKRADRAAFQQVLRATRPDLVCLGPLYKAYRATARENDELAAGEVQAVLDDFRTRYGFALLMEHHAPKATGLTGRDLVPYGSSLWLRWPELGLKLVPGGDGVPVGSLTVGRWRMDRMKNAWPDRLDRGGTGRWPWVGYWNEGMQ